MKEVNECLTFINNSPTAFHAVEQIKKECVNFIELNEGESWQLEKGKSYIVTRNQSSAIAFTIGKKVEELAFNIAASHTDSPSFKLKSNSEIEVNHALKGNVEAYGGMIIHTWMDRPLRLAGRVCIRNNNRIESVLYDTKKAVACIPNAAIHMNRKLNSGYEYNLQTDMMPLFSLNEKKGVLRRKISDDLNIQEEDLLNMDLFLCVDEAGKIWGMKDEFFSSPRIDNLESVFATLQAFSQAENENRVLVFAAFDNEEVGSNTKQGADSTFLYDVLKRIQHGLGYQDEDYMKALSHSMMLSVDNAHAQHYNHPEFSDAGNAVYMNEGVVIKSNANQQYTSDAVSASIFSEICRKAQIPVQYFVNKSDIRGGSTLGNISSSHLSIKSVDIGAAQLAMHSCFETAGCQDVFYMIKACQAFYESNLHEDQNGWEF